MRVFVAGLGCEVNSFVAARAGWADFAGYCLYRPGRDADVSIDNHGHVDMIGFALADGHEVIGGCVAFARPTGPLRNADYRSLRQEILDDLAAAGPVDLILLNLHGATLTEDGLHGEADLVRSIRQIVGRSAIIGGLLDLHAHLTPELVENADLLVAFKEYPHTDIAARARELYELSVAVAEGRIKPHMQVADCRMLAAYPTVLPAMASFVERMKHCEKLPGILSVSLIHGFPWGDIAECGARILVVAEETERAARLADELADAFFALRDAASLRPIPLEAALSQAAGLAGGPIVLADACDNPGGGAPGDATYVLAALIAGAIQGAALGLLYDPQAVDEAFAAGPGGRFDARIGGKLEAVSGRPVEGACEVLRLRHDAAQAHGGAGSAPLPLGRTAALRIGGVEIVVADTRVQSLSPEIFSEMGIDPQARRLLVVKSSVHFYAHFAPIAAGILFVATPGAINFDLSDLPYRRRVAPAWPRAGLTSRR